MNIKLFAKCSTVCCTGVSIKLWIECLGAFFSICTNVPDNCLAIR